MYFSIDDASYWYEIHGKPKGPSLVMLHGFTGSTSTWNEFIANWKNELRIITIDLPGHGKTTTPSPKTMEQCCADLAAFVQYLQLKEFHLAGYSMGGRTALSFAITYPWYIQSLMLESASPGLDTKYERDQRMAKDEQLAQKIENEGMSAFVDFWENIPLFQTQKHLPLDIQASVRQERLAQSAHGLAQSLRYMGTGSQSSWWNEMEHFRKPVLLITGIYDEKFLAINRRMNNCLGTSHLDIIENAGHAVHVEQPNIFGERLASFIFSH
ncbi:2-succinyl-6-hydroxy-2,4-cyclohexadiene-1-carboxylate synthase [Virgibacillus sp. NKC19-3]|uniref:2-succinyl-6-hydroxy-2, 4-cyclohexadiene-1-carboxylate synthase n=1 Tax=Virgibacillus saliphilus TaxID=2831674 RepID=UPI001C9B7252|nr:2-succinyl-6-hydroxy-2,4-cyclohexadiene-1-carboxylate synthase [Virgibacillus sp. NKC19-3]MBY7143950.1 2-succinyl-6-hydroxy-2,4-cyclohexadiene-1-carboxylate synthase [Virgibacillus sp. NKC19-3]